MTPINLNRDVVGAIRRAGKRRLRTGHFGQGATLLQLIGQAPPESSDRANGSATRVRTIVRELLGVERQAKVTVSEHGSRGVVEYRHGGNTVRLDFANFSLTAEFGKVSPK